MYNICGKDKFMKKLLLVILILLVGKVSLCADFEQNVSQEETQTVLTGNVEFDWLDIDQTGRDTIIAKLKAEMFPEDTVYKFSKKDFRNKYKDFLKDPDYQRHYMLVSNNVKETDDENLCGFYRGRLLISYAIQYKNDLRHVYYYDVLGNLRYVDNMSENYPNFPYNSKQYRSNGTLAGAIYFESHDLQYVYNNNKSFKGVWFKDKMFNNKAKQIMTRTNW